VNLMHWEWNELLEHIGDRSDIWSAVPDRPNSFFRAVDGEAVMALTARMPTAPGPYRQVTVIPVPILWTQDQVDGYLLDLVVKWTSYGFRMQVCSLLVDECGLDPKKAQMAAIAIGKMQQLPDKDPDCLGAQAVSDTFWPQEGDVQVDVPPEPEGMWYLTRRPWGEGGWLRLRLTGGQLALRCSLPTVNGDYHLPFDGFVRPRCGDASFALAVLLGWPVTVAPLPPDMGDSLPLGED